MRAHYDLLIRHGTCVLPWGTEATDVGVRNGRIAALGVAADASADETVYAKGLHVLPGLIDPHVHLRDPGDKTVETIPTGTRAAVLGGLAAVFDMPNTAPSIVDAEKLAWKQEYVEQVAWCDMGLYIGGTKTNIPEIASLELGEGVCAIKNLRRQFDRRPDGRGRRAPGARHALRPAPDRLSQRGRIPPAGPQTAVQIRRSLLHATWNGATRRPRSSAPAG